jgi:Uma2 family endonuclease
MARQVKQTPGETRHKISINQFERMIEVGIFAPGDRVELIEGEILDRAPINYPHEACVARLNRLLTLVAGDSGYVWPQNNSIRIPDLSRPQPDVTLLKWREDEYSPTGTPPTAADY